MRELKDKIVIITGSSGGIGERTARFFADAGCSVALAARRGRLLEEIADSLPGGRMRHLACTADISNDHDVKGLVAQVIEKYGKIDILVNNAAVSYIGRVMDMKIDKAQAVIDINLMGTIKVTREVLPYMIEKRSGHIITVSSVVGRRGVSYRSMYCASKFGVEGFMESLRSEVRKFNISVSIVRPPSVKTDFSNKIEPDSDVTRHAIDNLEIEEVGRAIVNLARRPRREVNIGLLAKTFLFLNGILPVLFDKIVEEK